MAFIDSGFDRNRPQVIGYRDPDLSPFVITSQTDRNLALFQYGIVAGATLRDFFYEVTLPSYLNRARAASVVLFKDAALRSQDFDPEDEEAARHAYVSMAWMHKLTQLSYLPTGFSRRGMLAAPKTLEAYVGRIDQMTGQLSAISQRGSSLEELPKASLSMLRTLAFFRTAHYFNSADIQLPQSERTTAQREREKLERLLGDTHIDL